MAKEKVPVTEINNLLAQGKTKGDIAKMYAVSLPTIYRILYRHGFISAKGNQRAGYEAVLKKYGKEHFEKMRRKVRKINEGNKKIKILCSEYEKLKRESEAGKTTRQEIRKRLARIDANTDTDILPPEMLAGYRQAYAEMLRTADHIHRSACEGEEK